MNDDNNNRTHVSHAITVYVYYTNYLHKQVQTIIIYFLFLLSTKMDVCTIYTARQILSICMSTSGRERERGNDIAKYALLKITENN